MKIEYDKEKNIIKVGTHEFSSYKNFENAWAFAYEILPLNNVYIVRMFPYTHDAMGKRVYTQSHKERAVMVGDVLGCSLSKFYSMFEKLQLKAFIVPVYPMYRLLADYKPWKKTKGWDVYLINSLIKNKAILDPVMEDGLYNILPLVHKTKRTPQQLSKLLKNNWKVLANNSLHKNKRLSSVLAYDPLSDVSSGDSKEYLTKRAENSIIKLSANLPTTLIPFLIYFKAEHVKWIETHFKGKWGDRKFVEGQLHMVADTFYLAEQLDKKVSLKWSPRRMKEEHDKMSHELNARKYPKDLFDSTNSIGVKSLKLGEYTATLLESAFDIATEGSEMGHCVAGYADSVKEGNYLVYSVTKEGERSSTIGVKSLQIGGYTATLLESAYEQKTGWSLQQHYGKYNKQVKDKDELELAKTVVDHLNKQLKDKQK